MDIQTILATIDWQTVIMMGLLVALAVAMIHLSRSVPQAGIKEMADAFAKFSFERALETAEKTPTIIDDQIILSMAEQHYYVSRNGDGSYNLVPRTNPPPQPAQQYEVAPFGGYQPGNHPKRNSEAVK